MCVEAPESTFKVGDIVAYRFKSGVATFVSYGAFSHRNSFIKYAGDRDNKMVLSHHLILVELETQEEIAAGHRIEQAK